MTDTADILRRLRAAIHMESAMIAPQTSPLIEAARDAADEIERLRAELGRGSLPIINVKQDE